MKKTLLALVLVFSLACAGALESMIPEPPFELPAESTMTQMNLNSEDGVSSTVMGYKIGGMNQAELQEYIQEKLVADGYEVHSQVTIGAAGVMTATKGSDLLAITVEPDGSGSKFELTWTRR